MWEWREGVGSMDSEGVEMVSEDVGGEMIKGVGWRVRV